ncbi:hypothetical protein GTY65_26210 [Streptomyces sp. SID8379]|nr:MULTISPECIES: hypothetical protein [unclassified Streptomyces]MYW67536.1 hypothetical protein [Streptomyces sp. SID8379]
MSRTSVAAVVRSVARTAGKLALGAAAVALPVVVQLQSAPLDLGWG